MDRNKNENPLVSVLMTAYNREGLIAQSIESVLRSDYGNFELIISDDCSTDKTVTVAEEYSAKDQRVRVHVNERNLSDYHNRNKAASLASGEFLLYVDSDDILYPHAIRTFIWCMDAHPEAALGFADIHDHEGPFPRLLQPKQAYERHFFNNYLFGRAPGSVMIKRKIFEEMGGFSGKRYIGDFEFWLRIAAIHPVVLVPGLLAWARKHEGQESTFDMFSYKKLTLEVAFAALNSPRCPLTAEQKEKIVVTMKGSLAKLAVRSFFKKGPGVSEIRIAARTFRIPAVYFIKALLPGRLNRIGHAE